MKATLRSGRLLAAVLLAGALSAPAAAAQVSIAPTALFLTDQERFGGLFVTNGSTVPQEVTVGFRFGFPAADSTGAVEIRYADSLSVDPRSVAPYIRAFPQRFILPPGETQVVRLTASPPEDAKDGLLWTRVVTTSTPQMEFEPDTTSEEGVRTRVQFRLQQVTALFYRKGQVDVDLGLGVLKAWADSAEVSLSAEMDHAGNAPFFGTASIRLLDGERRVVREAQQSIAVYEAERRRFTLPAGDLAPGTYTVELTISSERTDLPQEHLTRMAPITGSAQLVVPGGV